MVMITMSDAEIAKNNRLALLKQVAAGREQKKTEGKQMGKETGHLTCEQCGKGGFVKLYASHGKKVCSSCQAVRTCVNNKPDVALQIFREFDLEGLDAAENKNLHECLQEYGEFYKQVMAILMPDVAEGDSDYYKVMPNLPGMIRRCWDGAEAGSRLRVAVTAIREAFGVEGDVPDEELVSRLTTGVVDSEVLGLLKDHFPRWFAGRDQIAVIDSNLANISRYVERLQDVQARVHPGSDENDDVYWYQVEHLQDVIAHVRNAFNMDPSAPLEKLTEYASSQQNTLDEYQCNCNDLTKVNTEQRETILDLKRANSQLRKEIADMAADMMSVGSSAIVDDATLLDLALAALRGDGQVVADFLQGWRS